MTALIDADSIIFIIAYNAREKESGVSLDAEVDTFIEGLLLATDSDSYIGFLGSGTTFRHQMCEYYKAKRPEKPQYYKDHHVKIKERLIDHWKFVVVKNIEVDDAVSICHAQLEDTIICGGDKDFMQCPGLYFDFRTNTTYDITEDAADYNLWHQVLTGDSGDGIVGLKGVGPAKAEKILATDDGVDADIMRYLQVQEAFKSKLGQELGENEFELNIRLVQLLTEPCFGFEIPEIQRYELIR